MRNINKYNVSLSSSKSSPQRTTSQSREKILNILKLFTETIKLHYFYTESKVRSGETHLSVFKIKYMFNMH